jgi:site-specific recombinase XerC
MRLGNWLTADQGKKLLTVPSSESVRDKRDYAILSLLLGCGLRRAELTGLTLGHLQQRDEHWAIVNLYGKGGHIRTVPVPSWVKKALDRWLIAAAINEGAVFRRVSRTGRVWGPRISEKLVWWIVRQRAQVAGIECGLNWSMQHHLAVYWPGFQSPRSFAGVDSGAELPC